MYLSPARWLLLGGCFAACAAGDGASGPPPADATVEDVADVSAVYDSASPDVEVSVVCGDGVCTRGRETCETCPLDCNRCPTCDMAPSCTGALAVPTVTTPLEGCNNTLGNTDRTNYACGAELGSAPSNTTCSDPQLRIRIREISIQRGFFDVPRSLYCVVGAEDGAHSELLLITPREVAGNRNTTRINVPPSQGLFWGQGALFRTTSNLTISYACFLVSDGPAAQRVLDQIAMRAGMVAPAAGAYGWVFSTVSVLGTILGASLGTMRDAQILDVQQTIDAGALLALTNGRTWEIRNRRGNLSLSGASDLRITVESYGCADVRPTIP